MTQGFQVVDHVADVRVKAWGSGLKTIFSEMSRAMWFVMFGEAEIPASHRWPIQVTGIDMEDLLVGFLNEQLALFDIEGLAVSEVEEITFEESRDGQETCLKSVMCGSHVSYLDAKVNLQIKAATFHGLQLTPTEAWVTFDV
ncbi:MAG TPA: archease [Firmicutes bacterium]|nr:archease [Candidatus Fermentithermobacillaceae bacterium]